jgi:hypothetical protein
LEVEFYEKGANGAAFCGRHRDAKIDDALDLSGLHGELALCYSSMGRPSINPDLGG